MLPPPQPMTVNQAQVDRFLTLLLPVVTTICPAYGLDPEQCLREAAALSACGAVAMGHNFWGLEGVGDGGWYGSVAVSRTGMAHGGGVKTHYARMAKFLTPASAVEAWCRVQRAG